MQLNSRVPQSAKTIMMPGCPHVLNDSPISVGVVMDNDGYLGMSSAAISVVTRKSQRANHTAVEVQKIRTINYDDKNTNRPPPEGKEGSESKPIGKTRIINTRLHS